MAKAVWTDIVSIIVYFIIVLGIGLFATFRANTGTSQGYFLAGRATNWLLIGASTFSTNIGAHMFIGLAGSAASTGVAVVMFEWHAMVMLVCLGWFFLPVYRACGCFTMPQYLRLRFGGRRISFILSIIHTTQTIICTISVQMYSGALFIQQLFDWNIYLSACVLLMFTAIYTVLGGLTAVMWTDTIQTVIMVIGSMTLSVIALIRIGGMGQLEEKFLTSGANYTLTDIAVHGNQSNYTCGMPPDNSMHIFRSATDGNYPWPGMIIGLTILATNAWCTDQICVQRSLSAKNVSHAKGGVILAGFLKILSFILFVIPGMISRILFPNEVACADPDKCREICNNPSGCSNIAYPLLVYNILPIAFRGVMFASLVSAIVSSLTSFFNSSSTIFTMDIYKQIRRSAKERELMLVGRIYVVCLAGFTMAWLPALQLAMGTRFWDYTQNIYSHIIPPIVVTYLIGIFWKRGTEQGAFWSIVVCCVIGLGRLTLMWVRQGPYCGSGDVDTRWPILSHVHYLHFAIISSLVAFAVQILVSLLTKPRPPGKLHRVTFWTKADPEPQDLSSDEEDYEYDYDKDSVNDKELVDMSSGQYVKDEAEQPIKGSTEVEVAFKEPTESLCSKKKMMRYLCGVDMTKKKRMTKAEHLELQKELTDISESPASKRLLDGLAIFTVCVCVFIHTYYF